MALLAGVSCDQNRPVVPVWPLISGEARGGAAGRAAGAAGASGTAAAGRAGHGGHGGEAGALGKLPGRAGSGGVATAGKAASERWGMGIGGAVEARSDGGRGGGPTAPDTDQDGLDDATEEALGTDPTHPDTDGDTLSDGEEVALGTDPLVADSDHDGWTDAEEDSAGSDPLVPYTWDFESGSWPDFSAVAAAAGPSGTRYAIGEAVPDFIVFDQSGEPVSMYQFHGYVVLIVLSAGWCQHCQTEAPGLEALWESQRDQGLLVMHLLADDSVGSGFASLDFRQRWAQAFGLKFPVTGEGETLELLSALLESGLFEGYYPFFVLLDRQLHLDWTCVGILECDYRARIDQLLE